MQAQDQSLSTVLNGPKQFLIPIFQRTYSWSTGHCDQLLKDIVSAGITPHINTHFIGSVVLIGSTANSASFPQWQVIDGQQRLTTLTLLIAALLNRAKELGLQAIGPIPLEGIREYYLYNSYATDDFRYKLLLTKGDKAPLCRIIDDGTVDSSQASNVIRNYQYFYEMLETADSIHEVFRGIEKLKVVEVTLKAGEDDPQAIFESLNSTGLALCQADLIRNFVLMRQSLELQEQLYQQIWFPMEQHFGALYSTKFDRFMQDFLTLKTGSTTQIKSREVYPLFKRWYLGEIAKTDVQAVVNDLSRFARFYVLFSMGKEKNPILARAFESLNVLAEVSSLFAIALYDLYDSQTLTKDEFLQTLNLMASYLTRRSVCELQTRSLGNNLAALAKKINPEAVFESVSVALDRTNKNSRFPNDTEFTEALRNRDLYESRLCRFVLSEMQNNGKEKVDTAAFTIEHVLPQNENLRPEWKTMLGENWKTIQEKWLHRLGNLTLTGYNSEYQDKPFDIKKSMKGGFEDSPLRTLNKDIQDSVQWTEKEIEQRGYRLASLALDVWPPLSIDKQVVKEYALAERKAQAKTLSMSDVKGLDGEAKRLCKLLMEALDGNDTTTIISRKNITFYTLAPFFQVVPRKGRLLVIAALEYENLPADTQELAERTSDWSYIAHGDLSGVCASIRTSSDIEKALTLFNAAMIESLS